MTDNDHLQNITKNPVNFLKQSGKGFFVDKDGYLIALKDEMQTVLQEGGMKFADEVKDIEANPVPGTGKKVYKMDVQKYFADAPELVIKFLKLRYKSADACEKKILKQFFLSVTREK